MQMRYEGNWDRSGFDLLDMTDSAETAFIGWLTGREQTNVEEVAHFLEQAKQASQEVLNNLVEQGVLLETTEQGRARYRVHFAARRKRQATTAVWQALDDSGEMAGRSHETVHLAKKGRLLRGTKELVQGNYGRFWLGLSPLLLIFLVCEWLLVQKLESFAQMLDFLGIVALPVEIGVFPALLLYASRRKGEYVPGFILQFLAQPVIVGTIYLVSVGILFLHGLFIWQDTLQRAIAILVGVVVLGVTYLMVRQGAFACRLVIEVRQGPAEDRSGTFTVTDTCAGYL
jgi:predicted transcriptional regulator